MKLPWLLWLLLTIVIHFVFTILTYFYSITVKYKIFVGEKHLFFFLFLQTAEVPFLNTKFTYIYIYIYIYIYCRQVTSSGWTCSVLFYFVYLFLLIYLSHIKHITWLNSEGHVSNKMKVCANIWEVASMANWSKYPKELFIQRRLLFSAFPLLLMVCLVNFLFLQVLKGIKWISRGFFSRKLIPEKVGVYFTYYRYESMN